MPAVKIFGQQKCILNVYGSEVEHSESSRLVNDPIRVVLIQRNNLSYGMQMAKNSSKRLNSLLRNEIGIT